MIIGHRGVAGHYPENTRASIEAAIQLGLDWVEVDVQPTQDGKLVICHDHTIDRCSNGTGRVDQLSLAKLKQYDFGQWFDKRFSDESIMTLSELLNMSAEHNLKLNLEIKIDRHDPHFVCQLLKRQLKQAKLDPSQIVISSFSHQIIHQLYQQLPQYKIGVLCNRLDSKTKQLLKQVDAFSCNINYRWANKRLVERLKAQGYQVWSYTINNPSSLKHLPNLDAIFSDYPERFL